MAIRTRLPLIIPLMLAGACGPLHAQEMHVEGNNPLVTMMWTMADIMGLLKDNASPQGMPFMGNGWSGNPMGTMMNPMSAWPYAGAMPGMGMMPGMNSMPGMGAMPGMPAMPNWSNFANLPNQQAGQAWNRFLSAMPQGKGIGPAYPNTEFGNLDGLWQSDNGELLAIKGSQFRIQAGDNRSGGEIHTQGDRMILRNQESGIARQYEYLRNSKVLVMRGEDGQTLVFHRLGRGGAGGSPGYGGDTTYP